MVGASLQIMQIDVSSFENNAKDSPPMDSRHLRVAFLAAANTDNPYLTLLAQHLREIGHTITFVQQCSPQWLWQSRRTTDVLHFHWVQYFYNSPRVWVSSVWALIFFFKLLLARTLGYRIVWTFTTFCPTNVSRSRRPHRALFPDPAGRCTGGSLPQSSGSGDP